MSKTGNIKMANIKSKMKTSGMMLPACCAYLLAGVFLLSTRSFGEASAASPSGIRRTENRAFWNKITSKNGAPSKSDKKPLTVENREHILDGTLSMAESLAGKDDEIARLLFGAERRLREASHTVALHVGSVDATASGNAEKLPIHEEKQENWIVSSRAKLLEHEDESTLHQDRVARISKLETLMEGEVSVLGDVLTNCRVARDHARDIIKRDIYRRAGIGLPGAKSQDQSSTTVTSSTGSNKHHDGHQHEHVEEQKTAKEAIELAKQLQEMATDIRSEYMRMITGFAAAIVQNFRPDPKATAEQRLPLGVMEGDYTTPSAHISHSTTTGGGAGQNVASANKQAKSNIAASSANPESPLWV
ncbi:unnamed protein product [Amoebophrya sp. A25]|nr:unnamed protein product [Amoebophrya sp. A25]|eukprot:GSA25T00011301001.1